MVKIMDKEIRLRLKCETGRNCLDPIGEDGTPNINPKLCVACDFAQIEFLEIKDYVEKKEVLPKDFAPKEIEGTRPAEIEETDTRPSTETP